MPDSVAFAHFNVIHLDREVGIEGGLPDMLAIHLFSDSEWRVAVAGVLDCVDARFVECGEIEARILIAHLFAPGFDFALKSLVILATGRQAKHASGLRGIAERVEFDYSDLCALRCVANLVVGHDGRTGPSRNNVWMDVPYDGILRAARGNQSAHDKPAVLRLVAAVEEHERAGVRRDRDARKGILWRKYHALACGDGSWLCNSGRVFLHRAVGMARENAGGGVENIGFAKVGNGQELQVESRFANESGRERLVEVYCDAEAIRLGRDLNVIAEAAIRIRKKGGELIAGRRALAILESRNRIPLLRSGRKAHVAIG